MFGVVNSAANCKNVPLPFPCRKGGGAFVYRRDAYLAARSAA